MVEVFRKIFKQTFWQTTGKVVTSLSTFITLGLVARNYGEKGTGEFSLALTYLSLFYLFADFGFNAHILRQGTAEWRKLLGTRLVWSAVLVVIVVLTLPVWPFAGVEFGQAVLFGSLAIIASAVFLSCNLIFQSRLRYDLSVLSLSTGTLISLSVYLYLIKLKYPIPLLLTGYLLGWIITAIVALALVNKLIEGASPLFDYPYSKKLFKDCWPIAATLALNAVYFRADSFMIAYFKGVADVGVYNLAYQIFQSALVLPSFIMIAYYPLMLKSFKGMKTVGLVLFGLSFLAVILTIFSAPILIQILTDKGFAGSVVSLQILALGFPAYFMSSLLMWVMVSKGQYKKMLLIYAAGLVFNLILNFIYIPQHSYLAAAWTTIISEYLILVMQILLLRGIIS